MKIKSPPLKNFPSKKGFKNLSSNPIPINLQIKKNSQIKTRLTQFLISKYLTLLAFNFDCKASERSLAAKRLND
jgi:hypothetical protein